MEGSRNFQKICYRENEDLGHLSRKERDTEPSQNLINWLKRIKNNSLLNVCTFNQENHMSILSKLYTHVDILIILVLCIIKVVGNFKRTQVPLVGEGISQETGGDYINDWNITTEKVVQYFHLSISFLGKTGSKKVYCIA